jgi:uncharacterized protein YndB with AHSA1/START domain
MAGKRASAKSVAEREFTITRIVDAPRPLVFKAWTDPEHIQNWYTPSGYTITVFEWDTTPGGLIWLVLKDADGTECPVGGAFRQVVEPERLDFTELSLDREARLLFKAPTTVIFAERGGKTELTVQVRAIALDENAVFMIGAMDKGWTQTLDHLDQLIATLA